MQPSRQHCLWASLALLFFLSTAPRAQADTLTITSTPPGATVEIDGVVVGTTPFRTNFPGGYFHKPHTVFASRLDHAMTLRVSMEGYASEQMNLTEGPMDWVAVTGRREGSYFLLKSSRFDLKLSAAPQTNRSVTEPGRDAPLRPTNAALAEKSSQETAAPGSAETPGTGSIAVQSEPAGADIYVDGNFVGQTPATLKLASGAHRIEVRSSDHPPWIKNLDVMKDSQVTLRATFGEPDSGAAVDSASAK